MNKDFWDVKPVLRHRIKNDDVEVKVVWNDLNKSSSWIDMYALAIQDLQKFLDMQRTTTY